MSFLLAFASAFDALALYYWDVNGTAPGCGSATPNGTWGVDSYWNEDSAGAGSGTAAWSAGRPAVFAAGNDATGAYTVQVQGAVQVGDIHVDLGNVTFAPSAAGASLSLVDWASNNLNRLLSAGHKDANAVARFNVPLTGANGIIRYKRGRIILGATNSYAGPTTIEGGVLELGVPGAIPPGSSLILKNNNLSRSDFSSAWQNTPAVFATGGHSQQFGALKLAGSDATVRRVIDFGHGASAVAFADSSAEDWAGLTLTISNYTAGLDSLRFGASSSALTAAQLSWIQFADLGLSSATIDAQGYLTPAPPLPPAPPKWKFMVFSDTQGTDSATNQINTNILTELAWVTTNVMPALVLVPGDLVWSGRAEAFNQWKSIMSPVYQVGIGVYPVIGNHDDDSVSGFTSAFGVFLPDNGPTGEINRTYFVTHLNALLLGLDQCVSGNYYRVNQPWVNAILATNTLSHVFAFGHMPAFKAHHSDCLDDYPAERNAFWSSLRDAKARLYFCGHDHFHNHARIDDGDGNPNNDIHQITTGTGGGSLVTSYAFNGDNAPFIPREIFHEKQFGYMLVEIDGYNAKATWYHRTGANSYVATADVFSYANAPARPTINWSYVNGQMSLTWTGGGTLQAASHPSGLYTNIPGSASPFVIASPTDSARFYRVVLP